MSERTFTLSPTSDDEIRTNRLLWIERLERNEDPQTTGTLRNDNGFCCLGVACEVAGLPFREDNYWTDTEHRAADLPMEMVAALGATQVGDRGFVRELSITFGGKSDYYVTTLNDNLKFTFPRIAAVLREFWDLPL